MQLIDRLGGASGTEQSHPIRGIDDEREWVQLMGVSSDFSQGLGIAAFAKETFAKPLMGGGVVRVQLNGTTELRLGRRELDIHDQRVGQAGMRFGQAVVELHRLPCGHERFRNIVLGRRSGINRDDRMRVTQARIGQRIVRIEVDRLLKIAYRLLQVLGRALVPEVTTL